VAVISHTSYNKFVRTDCDYPYLYNTVTFYYTWSMMALFLHFYYTTYVTAKRSRPATTANNPVKSSANGHLLDSRKTPGADFMQNNNLVADASRERKEQ